jgi:hypothetical protein
VLLSFLILEPVGAVYPRKLWINPISQALQLDFSARLVMTRYSATTDLVIFPGPTVRADQKVSANFAHGPQSPRFFYFEYFPFPGPTFPDSIQHLTSALQGTTYQVHSPGDFSKAMQKMLEQLDSEREAQKREPRLR